LLPNVKVAFAASHGSTAPAGSFLNDSIETMIGAA
jgi:hypothetical protein